MADEPVIGRTKNLLDWVQRGVALGEVLGALGVGKIVHAILTSFTHIPSVWITPIWLLSSAGAMALLIVLVNRISKARSEIAPEGPTAKELNAKSEELENLKVYSATLNRQVASLNEKLKECTQKQQMPRPYLEVQDCTESMPRKTPFVFTNRGGDVAHKVQVQPLSINHWTVTFDPIETIAVGVEKSTLPTIVGSGVLQEHDILHLMVSEWDAAFRAVRLGGLDAGEWPAKVTITYEDFTGKQFEATVDLIVFPIQKTLRDKHGDATHEYKTVEVRNMKFREA